MVRSDRNPFLLQTIFLICISSFPPTIPITSISTTTSHPNRIHLGNETDRLSLLAFKSQLYDPLQITSTWNEFTHFCQWEGVYCGRRHQRVTALNLTSRGIVGSVSPYIGNMSFLRIIALQNNKFKGIIPHEIGHLSRLEVLSLYNNSFTGQIPTNLVRCSNLILLYLDSNELVGEIPSEFGSFTKLNSLWVGKNELIGRIPVALGNISSLQTLSAPYNYLDGSIPDSLGQLKKLTQLGLGANMLSGTVPSSIYNLSTLEAVDFAVNQLEGSLPPSIGLPNYLRIVTIGGNQFSGTLHASLFTNASRLSKLDVASNRFVGQVPIEVGYLKKIKFLSFGGNHFGSGGKNDDLGFITYLSNCSHLEILSLESNNFGGRLPASLTNLSGTLKQFSLGSNQLFGSIPSGMSNLKNLLQLDATFNSLTGTIPNDIGMLQKLQYLGLGENSLSGKMPSTIGNLTSLYWLNLSYNMLEGSIEPRLGKCLLLRNLYVQNNHLSGNLPKQILGLSINLLEIDMSNNYINGSLPQEVGQLKNLQYLKLFGNKLSGEIPTTLGSCSGLEGLYLAGNSFQRHIPSSFGDLVAIEIIDLSRNNLSGKIPRNLENLHNLRYLNLSFNNFEGEVPTKGIFQNVTGFSIIENNKLCGGSSKLKLRKCYVQKPKKKEIHMTLKVIIGVFGSLSVIGALLVLIALHLRKESTAKSEFESEKHANDLQRISYIEIREATNGFSSSNLIGTGSFATVYKGVLRDGGSFIAVKVFNLMERDFNGNDFKALILEFMPYGSLEDWLHSSSNRSQRSPRALNLFQRLNIAIDVASALDYLHNSNDTPIVHCDLKPSNVLLSEDLVASVGDFGLAKFLSPSHGDQDKSETTSNIVRGTVGYIPPEYAMGSAVSTKGDVYSFGIMLLEMFTGRRPTDEIFNDNLSLNKFCQVNLVEQNLDILNIIPLVEQPQSDIEEDRIMSQSMKKCLLSALEIGVVCSSEAAGDRMEIKDGLKKMQKIKEEFVMNMNQDENCNIESHI